MFVLGIIALIILVLIVANTANDSIDGIWGIAILICLVVIFVFCIFAIISVVLAIMKGLKKDKATFLKKFLSNIVLMTIAYLVPYILDCFYEFKIPIEFEFGKLALRVILTALVIIGGEYMLADHSKENNDELHF